MEDIPEFTRSDFKKSRKSEPKQDCVEVAIHPLGVEFRDSKTKFGAKDDYRLRLSPEAYDGFLAAVLEEQ